MDDHWEKISSKLLFRFTDLVYNLVDISSHASSFVPSHPPTSTITFAGYLGKHIRGRPLKRVILLPYLHPRTMYPDIDEFTFPFRILFRGIRTFGLFHHDTSYTLVLLLLLEYT